MDFISRSLTIIAIMFNITYENNKCSSPFSFKILYKDNKKSP